MAVLKITEAQAHELLKARTESKYVRKNIKKRIFGDIHRTLNIPRSQKIKFFIENPEHPEYLVVRDKRTGKALNNGVPEPVVSMAVKTTPAPAKAPEKAVAAIKPAAKGKAKPAVKTPAKKAPAKAAVKTAAKPAAKKAAPAKPVAKAAKKVEKDSFSKTKTDKCQIEVRATLGNKRVRLGYASSQEMKAKVIAKAKAGK